MTLRDGFDRHVCPTSPFPNGLEVARAEGCLLFDAQGRSYLDFISGISVTNVGHCHPMVTRAVAQQAALYAHTMVYGEHVQAPQVELASAIAAVAPDGMDATYFLTTGAEANDAALKLAVKLTGRSGIAAFRGAYHGDTVGALACLGSEKFRRPFAPILHPVEFLDYGSVADLERITDSMAAAIVEPVQGEAGIVVPPPGWLLALRNRCTQCGAILVFDEVQTAFGRVGDWFAARRFGVRPDVLTVAKAMGAGLPLAGVVGPRDMLRRFAADPPFSHITTFGGNPVCCAAGLAAMAVIREEGLLDNANRMGTLLTDALRGMAAQRSCVRDVRGVGLMIGVQLDSAQRARRVVEHCRRNDVLLETTLLDERTVRFSPPLVVRTAHCDQALQAFQDALDN